MTISTYADLKSQVASHLNRSNLTAQIPVFIQLCETRIYYGCTEKPFESDPLRISAMEQSSYATFDAQTIALPSDYLAHRRLYLGSAGRLTFRTPDVFWDKWFLGSSGQPKDFTIEGENLILGPEPDASYTGRLLYYKRFTALATDSDTNWILTNAPGAYLWGTLTEAYRFIRNMDQATAALNSFAGIINGLNDANKSDTYASAWQASADIYTP